MDPNQETDNFEDLVELSEEGESDESTSVDDFIKQLEEKEKDLNITAETTFIEIAEGFDDDDDEMPDFLAQEFSKNGKKNIIPAFPAPAADDSALQDEIAELKEKIVTMEAERSEMFANSQRRAKDFEAFKTRTERERKNTFQSQLSNLATKMLPPLDNLDRALSFASAMPEKKRNEFQKFFEGIVLVSQQVNEVLAGMGIKPIPAVGELFDPHLHEAVAIEEESDFPPNTISEELLRGYSIGDKVVRHSMVKVTKPAPVEPTVYGELDPSTAAELADESDSTTDADTEASEPTSEAE